jgi:type IV pilus assembly protein PilW
VLADVIQQGGYYPSGAPQAQTQTQTTALPAVGVTMQNGQAFYGSHPAAAGPDTLTVRYMTQGGDGLIMCDGSTNTAGAATQTVESNAFTVVPPAGNVPGQLQCTLSAGNPPVVVDGPVTLVNGVQSLVVYYGVNRSAPAANYNVDTYLTADQMNAADWMNISSVRIVLTFTNPLCPNGPGPTCQPGMPATLQFERIVPVMGRSGYHS